MLKSFLSQLPNPQKLLNNFRRSKHILEPSEPDSTLNLLGSKPKKKPVVDIYSFEIRFFSAFCLMLVSLIGLVISILNTRASAELKNLSTDLESSMFSYRMEIADPKYDGMIEKKERILKYIALMNSRKSFARYSSMYNLMDKYPSDVKVKQVNVDLKSASMTFDASAPIVAARFIGDVLRLDYVSSIALQAAGFSKDAKLMEVLIKINLK